MPTKFKVGDKVKVLRTAKTHENGWGNSWMSEMTGRVGQVAEVVGFGQEKDVRLKFADEVSYKFGYPEFVLELVPEVPFQEQRQASEQGKQAGIARAIAGHSQAFKQARLAALELGRTVKFVNADMVQAELEKLGLNSSDLGNAAGAIFRGKNWKDTGRAVLSNRNKSHRRKITVWEYTGTAELGNHLTWDDAIKSPAAQQAAKHGIALRNALAPVLGGTVIISPTGERLVQNVTEGKLVPAAQQAKKHGTSWQDTIGAALAAKHGTAVRDALTPVLGPVTSVSPSVPLVELTRETAKKGLRVAIGPKYMNSKMVGTQGEIVSNTGVYIAVRMDTNAEHYFKPEELVSAPRYVPATPENVKVGSKIRVINLGGKTNVPDVGVTGVVIEIRPNTAWSIRFRYDEGTRAAGRNGIVSLSEIEVLV